ncbi:MAG TPA: flippase [Thermoanaerobaculia bacterium]|nr:flippase [Thermoanaerobaculia bacterium]
MSDPRSLNGPELLSEAELLGDAPPFNAASPPRPSAGLTSRVVRGSLLNLGGQGVTMLTTLVATPFVIRLLGAPGYGLLALVHVLIGYLSFADMGMGTASTRFGSVAHARGDDEGESAVIWTSLAIAAVPAATVALALALGARPLVAYGLRLPVSLQASAVIAVRLAALGFLARALAGVLNTPAMVRLRMDLVVLVTAGTSVGQILLVPVVLFLGGGLTGAVMVVAGAGLTAALSYAVIGARLLPRMRRPHINGELPKSLTRFGGGLVVSSIAGIVLANLEKLLLPRYASVQALAYYSVAFTLAFMLTQLPVAMVQSLVPAFSQLHVNPDSTQLELLYRRALRGMLYWALPGAVFICTVARPFFTLWAGPQFGRESTLPLYLLMGGVVCEIMAYVPSTLLITLGRSDLIARCQVSLVIPYVISSAFLIHRFGAAGAAVAWSLRALASAFLFLRFARRSSGFAFAPWPENRRDYALTVIVLLVPVTLTALLTSSMIARIGVAAAAVAVHGALILTRVLTEDERAALQRMVPFALGSRD